MEGPLRLISVALVLLSFGAGEGWGQSFPSKPVRLVVPYPPGGATDIVGRLYAQHFSAGLGQPVVVENRPGAGATIGTQAVAKASSDGYTILLGTLSNLACAPSLYPNVGYDPVKSFSAIGRLTNSSFAIIAHPALPADSLPALIKLARARPNELMYMSVGSGTLPHVAGEMFSAAAGIKLMHVPYRGGEGSGSADLLSGRVQLTFNQLPQFQPYLQAGRLKVLAIAGPRRLAQLPGVPTTAEAGVPEFQVESWFGLVAPAGTPADAIKRLNTEIAKAAESKELRDALAARGAEAAASSPETLSILISDGVANCSRVIKTAGIKLD